MNVCVPIDVESRIEFRRLKAEVGPEAALATVLRLWLTLGQLARATRRVGFLPAEMESEILAGQASEPMQKGLGLTGEANALPGFLRREEGGWYCEVFEGQNRELSPDFISRERKGGIAKGMAGKREEAQASAAQMTLLVPPDAFTLPDGTPMTPGQTRLCTNLIAQLDSYLRLPGRQPRDFTKGLVQDAQRVWDQYDGVAVDRVCMWIYIQRENNHPALPKTTEGCLREWENMVKMVS